MRIRYSSDICLGNPRISECLEMLDTLPDLDYLVIENWLFKAPLVKKPMPEEEKAEWGVKPLE